MKKFQSLLPVLMCFFFLLAFTTTQAQIWKKIKNEVKSRTENKVVNKAGDATDKTIDKTTDAIAKNGNDDYSSDENNIPDNNNSKSAVAASYKNYDFVPGDKIIFEPDLSTEADAELPARYTIKAGTAEIQSDEGEKVLHLQKDAKTAVEPLMSTTHYLPEQFTLEFDMMLENDEGSYFRYTSEFDVAFTKMGNTNFYNGGLYWFTIYNNSKCLLGTKGSQDFPPALTKSFSGNTWHHVAIYVRKNIGKSYVDGYRVSATNSLPVGANKFYIKADRYGVKIKNLRKRRQTINLRKMR